MRIFRAHNVFDGTSLRRDSEVVVDDAGVIVAVRAVEPVASDVDVIDYGPGTTLLPGLIDGHQHLSWGCTATVIDGFPGDPDAQREQTVANAHRALAAGITTVQDLGDSAYSVVDLRDATRCDRSLPRLLASGPPITSRGGHCHFLTGAETDSAAVGAAVAQRAERGVDVIKVMVSGGNVTPGSLPWQSQFDLETLQRLVDAAHNRGLPVAAHAHGSQALRDCVTARVDSIEHCTFMTADGIDDDPALREEITRAGIVVRVTPGTIPNSPPPPPAIAARMARLLPLFAQLRIQGARIVISSDAGIGPGKPHDVLPYAIGDVATLTGDPIDALTRATSGAADALGLTDVCGRLAPGLTADLLVVRGDPTTDPTDLLHVEAVYRDGDLVTAPRGGQQPVAV